MKRLIFLLALLFTLSVHALHDGEVVFTAPIPIDDGSVMMSFHYNPWKQAVAVGTEEYSKTSIPIDTEGELYIPDSIPYEGRNLPVRWISRGSFQPCPRLTKVRLPKSIVTISDLAFEGCKSLREVNIPDSVFVIFPRAFFGCTSLRRVCFQPSTPPYCYTNETFDNAAYATATMVIPAKSAEAYLSALLTYRFRYHAEVLPLYNENP